MMAEPATAQLTKAQQKRTDEALTPAELAAFGVLPPAPDKPELPQSPAVEHKS